MHKGPIDHVEAAIWAEGYEAALKDAEKILGLVLVVNPIDGIRISEALKFLRDEQ